MFLSNIIISITFNNKMSEFKTFYSEMNDITNIFVPISFYHLQFTKYFLSKDRTAELGTTKIFSSGISEKYFNLYNEELDTMFSKSYIDMLFSESSYFIDLIPYQKIDHPELQAIKTLSLPELLFEFNYRFIQFNKAYDESAAHNLDYTLIEDFNN